MAVPNSDRESALRAFLGTAYGLLPEPEVDTPVAVLPITREQWCRSVSDATLPVQLDNYRSQRLALTAAMRPGGAAANRGLRAAARELAGAAGALCGRLDCLSALSPDRELPERCRHWREAVVLDARESILAAIGGTKQPTEPKWPTDLPLPNVGDRDVLFEVFGLHGTELDDDSGSFSEARLLAYHRLRIADLQHACDPIVGLVTSQPLSVFASAVAVRDLATSASPFVSLCTARDIRDRILTAFASNPERTVSVLCETAAELDKEWTTYARIAQSVHDAATATTEGRRAVHLLEAYKRLAEGHTRRWVWMLLRLTGLDGPPFTVGRLGEPAAARLGELGGRIAAALQPALRNAEAHEDFVFDEDAGELTAGQVRFSPDEIEARFVDLDVMQRGVLLGRLAALADASSLADRLAASSTTVPAGEALRFARQRFGHAGQRVRSFVRNRDQLNVVLDDLIPEACNPCFVALTQTAQILPTVSRFVVHIRDLTAPVIDLPADVLRANWPVFELGARLFPDMLPQSTFLPCLAWLRLGHESVADTGRTAAWFVLNDAQHAILDVGGLTRLLAHFQVVSMSAAVTLDVLPIGPHLGDLHRARRMVRRLGRVLADGGSMNTTAVLADGIARALDRLGDPPAVLPGLDARPMPMRSHPQKIS